jgi:hypothetical protein
MRRHICIESPDGSSADSIFSDNMPKTYSETEASQYTDQDWVEQRLELGMSPETFHFSNSKAEAHPIKTGTTGNHRDRLPCASMPDTPLGVIEAHEGGAEQKTSTDIGNIQAPASRGRAVTSDSEETEVEEESGGHWLGKDMDMEMDLVEDIVGDDEDQLTDGYWVWNRRLQRFCHWDAETSRWIFCPESFD